MIGLQARVMAARRAALGTTLVDSEDFKKSVAGLKCIPNYGRAAGQICCMGLDPGDPLLDGRPSCPDNYGPVPMSFANVTAVKLPDGRAVIVAGPPRTELTDPFAVPGDTRPPPARPKAPTSKKKAPAAPGAPPPAVPAEQGFLDRYGGALVIAGAAMLAAILLTRGKAASVVVAPSAPAASPLPVAQPALPAAAPTAAATVA